MTDSILDEMWEMVMNRLKEGGTALIVFGESRKYVRTTYFISYDSCIQRPVYTTDRNPDMVERIEPMQQNIDILLDYLLEDSPHHE